MPRSKIVWTVVWLLALIVNIGAMCLVARLLIVTPFGWLRQGSGIYHIQSAARVEPSVVVEPQLKCLVGPCDLFGSPAPGINSLEVLRPTGPSQSVGIMCLFYGSTLPAIDGWLQTTIQEEEGLVYMCDL